MLRNWGLGIALLLGLAVAIGGVMLVSAQQQLPMIRDQEVFEEGMGTLYGEASISGDYREASRAFHVLRAAHDTGVSRMLDIGFSLIACGGVLALVAAVLLASRRARWAIVEARGPWTVVAVAALASILLGTGSFAQAVATFDRYEVPPWADSLSIPMMGAIALTLISFVLMGMIAGVPLLRRIPASVPLWVRPRANAGGLIASVVYGALSFLLLYLIIESFDDPGGWLILPALALMVWLMLNARAIASA